MSALTIMRHAATRLELAADTMKPDEAMALKTVTRRLFKWLPVSIEMARAVGLDEAADIDLSQNNAAVLEGVADSAPLELQHEQGDEDSPPPREPERDKDTGEILPPELQP